MGCEHGSGGSARADPLPVRLKAMLTADLKAITANAVVIFGMEGGHQAVEQTANTLAAYHRVGYDWCHKSQLCLRTAVSLA